MFIALEGPDGGGKSTLRDALARRLEARGLAVRTVRDPGDTALGRAIRPWLLSPPAGGQPAPMAELHLFLAARAQMCAEAVAPALAAGQIVLADRFWLSTLAYQGSLPALRQALGDEKLRAMATAGLEGIEPSHWIVLDIPPEVARRRLADARDRIESRGDAYFAEVRGRYRTEAARLPAGKALWLDGAAPAGLVADAAWAWLLADVERLKPEA